MNVLHHVGIAVRSISERVALYRTLGIDESGREEVPSQQVRVAFLDLQGTRLELLEPTSDSSPIAGFLSKRGEGVHHLCFEVDDIVASMAALRRDGYRLLTETPERGAQGARVCFVHPRGAGGVLIELWESAKGGAD